MVIEDEIVLLIVFGLPVLIMLFVLAAKYIILKLQYQSECENRRKLFKCFLNGWKADQQLGIDLAKLLGHPKEHSWWIETGKEDADGNRLYRCAACNEFDMHHPGIKVPYCWNCGAPMDAMDGRIEDNDL